jgi:small-conductance mechanosensitive channel
MSGIRIYRNGFFLEGDTIVMDNIEGKIVHISLLETHVETKNGDLINIPNSNFVKKNVTKKKAKRKKKTEENK